MLHRLTRPARRKAARLPAPRRLLARRKAFPSASAAAAAGSNRVKSDRLSALQTAMDHINKQYGSGTVMRLEGDYAAARSVEAVSTGSIGVDDALGVGGLPRGRIVEVSGPEASGKTTLALHVVAQAQKAGGVCAFVDAEHALNPDHARRIGVSLEDLVLSQPDSGEQALEICEQIVRSGGADVVVVDSVAALVPEAELRGEMGDAHMALQARLMSQAMRKITGVVAQQKCLVIFVNQIRMKVGVMFGSPEVTPGGNALKFAASVRLDIRRIGAVKGGDGESPIGNRVRVKVVKNKVAPPFRSAEFDLLFDRGISKQSEILDLGVEHGVVKRAGAWYSYGDTRLGQGRDQSRLFLEENAELADEIEAKIREAFAPKRAAEEEQEVEEEKEQEEGDDYDDNNNKL